MITRRIVTALTWCLIAPLLGDFQSTVGAVDQVDFYVAPTGNDANPGTEASPFATIEQARNAVRKKISDGLTSDLLVLIRGGTYELSQPLTFDNRDSGTDQFSITYASHPGEQALISGGRSITGWQQESNGLWSVVLPEVASGKWYFRQLFVNDQRAIRARKPNITDKEPCYRLKDSLISSDLQSFAVTLPQGQVANWKNPSDVEIVMLGHWEITRKLLQAVGLSSDTLLLAPPHILGQQGFTRPSSGTPSYLENARAFLDQPGEWYLDRQSGKLTYWPLPEEDIANATVVAPILSRLIKVRGDSSRPVRNIHFNGITFAHTDWELPAMGFTGYQASFYLQQNWGVEGRPSAIPSEALLMEMTKSCSVSNCSFVHLGGTGLRLRRGCSENRIEGNCVHDVAGGGIMVGEVPNPLKAEEFVHDNKVIDNDIFDCGKVFHGAVGIWVGMTQNTVVSHNEVHNLPYTGVSVGWEWGTKPTNCSSNLIEHNHIYNVMNLLSDGGGIYTLGLQPGTVLRGNLIHDVVRNPITAVGAPNNGIFFDEGSKGFCVQNNIVYKTAGPPIRFNASSPEQHTFIQNFFGEYVFWKGIAGKYALKTADDHYWDQPNAPGLDPQLLTVSTWIRPLSFLSNKDTKDPSYWLVCKNGDEFTDGHYSLLISHQNIGAYLNIGGGRENIYAAWSHNNPIPSNEWTHVAMTYDGQKLAVYCNGRLAGRTDVSNQELNHRGAERIESNSVSSAAPPSTALPLASSPLPRTQGSGLLRIGKRADNYGQSFPGLMDDVRIYNRGLSETEIREQWAEVRTQELKHRDTERAESIPSLSSVSPVTSVVNNSPPSRTSSSLVFHLDFTAIHDKIEEIKANAGPEEPYRSRFAAAESKRAEVRSQESGNGNN
jgi:hypothetical protein